MCLVVCVFAGSFAAAESSLVLTGHVPGLVGNSVLVERAPADEVVELGLVVNIDQALLSQTLNNLYEPGAPANKPFLTPLQFAQQFDLPDKRQILMNFAQANGLTVDETQNQPNSLIVSVTGPASAVEGAFQIHLNHYQAPNGQVFRSSDVDPSIPSSLAPHLLAITGLSNNTGVAYPHINFHTAGAPLALPGTGPGGGMSPSDIKTVYGLHGTSLTGSGQTVAIFELDGFKPSDITGYESQFNITPAVIPSIVSVDGTSNIAGSNTVEDCLDIEMVAALAPGVSRILVYEDSPTAKGVLDTYNKIASDDLASVVSTSWGNDEFDTGSAMLNAESVFFQQMAAQGQTIYAASGDFGAYDRGGDTILAVDDPSSQQDVTGAGGTSLSGTLQNPIETVWNNGFNQPGNRGNYSASGGGVSSQWSLPSYQSGVAGLASTQFRNTPDVALNADPNNSPYSIFVNGAWALVGGTSAAAPLWAAETALINQQRVSKGNGVLGFANPSLYAVGTSASYTSDFNDITSGNNGFYNAKVGYDNCTGFGSFKGTALAGSASSPTTTIIQNAPSISSVYPYPNPWDVRNSALAPDVTFANLVPGDTVKIFSLAGYLVKTLTAPSSSNASVSISWDLTNDSGQPVASGLYFYLASDGNSTSRGKIAVIR